MRKLKRSIARANMKAMGYERINKKRHTAEGKGRKSIFSQNWRDLVFPSKKDYAIAARRMRNMEAAKRKAQSKQAVKDRKQA